ncbi:A24 family peptidase [Nocardioides sp. YIM 152315]|uniref:prepilin peptidase n=1 Tax=Nocardioides sp. YIM 152315 TaxID=3031760 RepID=UPI0023DA97B4|nr:A24 family peptidase [Nocardioides sp. YIM 152315]MDF1605606.1 A24 family peptidase [Nocardioides sp. YIM 152315]
MSSDLAAAGLGAAACGVGALGVPTLISRIPEPASAEPGDPPRYAPVATRPGLARRAVVVAAVCGAVVGASVGMSWPLLYLLPLVPVAVALGIVDLHTHLLPTRVIWPALAVTAVLALVAALLDDDLDAVVRAAICGVVLFACFHALWWLHPAGMGYGDVRLSALVGFALGYLGRLELLVGVYAAFVVFALLGLVRAVVRRDRGALRTALPFGPFLLGGALVGVAVGGYVWSSLVSG